MTDIERLNALSARISRLEESHNRLCLRTRKRGGNPDLVITEPIPCPSQTPTSERSLSREPRMMRMPGMPIERDHPEGAHCAHYGCVPVSPASPGEQGAGAGGTGQRQTGAASRVSSHATAPDALPTSNTSGSANTATVDSLSTPAASPEPAMETAEKLLERSGLYCRGCANRIKTSGMDHTPDCPLAYVSASFLAEQIDARDAQHQARYDAVVKERDLSRQWISDQRGVVASLESERDALAVKLREAEKQVTEAHGYWGMRDQSIAWKAVANALSSVDPDWCRPGKTGRESAVAWITLRSQARPAGGGG